jgi:signal transduction histidine kinase
MSKREPLTNRLDELFSDADLPNPEPEEGAALVEMSPPSGISVAPLVSQDSPLPSESPLTSQKDQWDRLGWDDFLNAIDRSEKIGFVYDQNDITPLDGDDGTGLDPSSAVEVPLQIGDDILGALQLEGDAELGPEEAELLTSVARQVSQHVENLRLLTQAEQYRAEAEEATRRMTREGWDEYLSLADGPSSGFVYDQNRVSPLSTTADILEVDSAVVVQDLILRDAPIGQLVVSETEQDEETVSNLVTTISQRLSTHIESLRLLDETERGRQQLDKRAAELQTVAQVSTAAATILDPDSLLQSVVDLTRYSFSLYHSSVYLLSESGNALDLIAASGETGQDILKEGHSVLLTQEQSIVAKAARNRDVIIVADSETDPEFLPNTFLPDVRSAMAIPMIVADQLVGVFDVEADGPGRFSEEDKQTYITLASQTAVALRNAQLYAEQMATVERLRELDNMKSAFLANMSHELRTPLNSILGFTQVILEELDGPLTENMESDLVLIDKNGQHLLNLINDVLDMARIEAGRVSFYVEQVNLPFLLGDVLKTNSPMAREKSLVLKLVSNLEEGQKIKADSVRLRQVLINVVGNSLKFTDEGGITVQADQIGENIQIRVKDTGVGIPPDKLESIFEAFSQVDTTTTRKAGGTGLGLPISRRLVEMHGGRMWAESTGVLGEGATTIIELPIDGPKEEVDEE